MTCCTRGPDSAIVSAEPFGAMRMRGFQTSMMRAWPTMGVGDVRRVGVMFPRFSQDRIVSAQVTMTGVTLGPIDIAGNTIFLPVLALSSGTQTATVSARSDSGDVQTITVGLPVSALQSLITGTLPTYADAAYVYGDVFFPDPSGDAPLLMV